MDKDAQYIDSNIVIIVSVSAVKLGPIITISIRQIDLYINKLKIITTILSVTCVIWLHFIYIYKYKYKELKNKCVICSPPWLKFIVYKLFPQLLH